MHDLTARTVVGGAEGGKWAGQGPYDRPVRRALACIWLVAVVGLAGCGASGGGTGAETSSKHTSGGPTGSGQFGKDIVVDGLTMRVAEPYRESFSPQAVEVDVTFRTSGPKAVKTPDPTLTCMGQSYEIDNDIANYPSEVSDRDHGTWAWTPGPDCEKGSFKVGDTTVSFTSVAKH